MAFTRTLALAFIAFLIGSGAASASSSAAQPLTIGESWVIDSAILKEKRTINVYRPPGLPEHVALPVLYMPDGGLAEDFLHIAGLLQVGTANGTIRAFLLVGIENTERRRDLTGPTDIDKDRSIAPKVGGSRAFRSFIRNELMPEVEKRYRVTDERAIVGESLAGLFVIETLIESPDMFDTYIALDPSLWWNAGKLLVQGHYGNRNFNGKKNLYIGSSKDGQGFIDRAKLADDFEKRDHLNYRYEDWPSETHATIYHPAALKAFRIMFHPGSGEASH